MLLTRIVVLMLALGCRVASAQPVDCERLRSTKVPFQITQTTDAYSVVGQNDQTITVAARTSIVQIYRNDDGWMVIYGADADGQKGFRTESRYGLFRVNEPRGSQAYRVTRTYPEEWAADPRAEGHDVVIKSRQVFRTDSTQVERDFETKYTFLRKEGIFLGPCRFGVNVYDVEIKMLAGERIESTSANRIWYSPELMVNIATDDQRPSKNASPITVHTASVKIETEFRPYAQ